MKRWIAHPDEGQWRAYLDGELPPEQLATLRTHLTSCSACQARLTEVDAAARFAGDLLGTLAEAAAQAPVPARPPLPSARVHVPKEEIPMREPRRFKLRYALAAAAAAFVLSLLVPGVRARAAEWVSIFRVKEARTVQLSTEDVAAASRFTHSGLPDAIMDRYLKEEVLTKLSQQDRVGLADLKEMGFKAPSYLPEGYGSENGSWVNPGSRAYTPDVDGINTLLAAAGSKVQLPKELKGRTVEIAFHPITGFTWTKEGQSLQLIEGVPPTISIGGGVDVKETLVSLAPVLGKEIGLSGDLLTQLQAMDLSSTLPLPVVQGQGREVTIRGRKGTTYEGDGHIVIAWMSETQVNVLVGSEPFPEMLKIAESLED